jgi:hypothetical protein
MVTRLILCAAVILGTTSSALAALTPPSWYGDEGSTHQQWSFSDSSLTPKPDVLDNDYGTPLLRVVPVGDWLEDPGAWPLSGQIDVYIPNRQELLPFKEILLQLTWMAGDSDSSPFLPNQPVVGITSNPLFTRMEMSRQDTRGQNDWIDSLFTIRLYPNPYEEWITIKGDIIVDQVEIYTICVPEPTTLALLGIGGLVTTTIGRRRRRPA